MFKTYALCLSKSFTWFGKCFFAKQCWQKFKCDNKNYRPLRKVLSSDIKNVRGSLTVTYTLRAGNYIVQTYTADAKWKQEQN